VTGFDDILPAYNGAFSAPFVRAGSYARMAQDGAAITLAVPLAGTWNVHGELEGDLAGKVQFAIDGQATPVQTTVFSETLQAFSLQKQLDLGSHTLILRVPERAATGADQDCRRLCVRNLIVRLDEPAMIDTQVTQTFGGQVSLTGYSLQEYQPSEGDVPEYALFTRWSCEAPLPEDYTLYMHYVDGSGALLAQDDHLLGRHRADETLPTGQWTCPGDYTDVSYVPRELAETGAISVAFGLWMPGVGQYLPPSGQLPIDQFGRVRLEVSE
jgi:hypothetical protein